MGINMFKYILRLKIHIDIGRPLLKGNIGILNELVIFYFRPCLEMYGAIDTDE